MIKIKKLRDKCGISQMQLAKMLEIDRSTVAKWETGEASPRSDKLPVLAKALECKIDDLFEPTA